MWVVKSVATNRTAENHIQVKSRAIDLGLEKGEVVAELGGSQAMIMEASPVNEHLSNGVVERAVETVGVMIRTPNKLALEQSCSREFGADHVVISWLIMHAVTVSLFEAKFFNGVYLGLRFGANEMYIGTATGVVQSPSDQAKDRARTFAWGTVRW